MAKTHEFKGIVFTDIPKEVVEKLGIKPGDEVNFIISGEQVLFEKKKKEAKGEVTDAEKKLMNELMKIRHSERKTSSIQKLVAENKEVFENLLKKGLLFKYSKEGEEFIGVDRNYYSNFSKKEEKGLLGELEEKGYLILEDKKEIYRISKEVEEKKKQVRGVMGFDKKLYLVTEKKYSEAKQKIEKQLQEPLTIEEASEKTGLEKGLVKAMIELLKEQGDLIEKTKGVYQAI